MHQLSFSIISLAMLLVSCGSLTDLTSPKQLIKIVVYGVYSEPDGAEGNVAPQFYEMAFEGITLFPEGGDSDVEFAPDDPDSLKIIDRPQIVYEDDISDYEEDSFSNATLSFDADVTVGTKVRKDYSISLDDPTIDVGKQFSVEKGKGLKFIVKVKWQNTVTREDDSDSEEIGQPDFELTVEDD